MGRTRKQMSQETTAALLSAACEYFAREGYAETSMDALCAHVGLTRGALYHHFGGKEGLLEAVVRQLDAEIAHAMEAAWSREEDPWAAFRACCVAYLDEALRPDVQQVYLRDAVAVMGQRLRDIDAESIGPMIEALEELMADGRIVHAHPEALARLLSGAMVDAALWVGTSEDPETTLEQATSGLLALLDGLVARPAAGGQ